MNTDFISECLSGRANIEDIDDWIDRWHSSSSSLSLDEFLGFTKEEGNMFFSNPSTLQEILENRRKTI